MNPTLKGIDQWPNTAPSSPATPSESPERVETAEEAFDVWWVNPANPYIGDRYQAKTAFRAGYEAGRRAK